MRRSSSIRLVSVLVLSVLLFTAGCGTVGSNNTNKTENTSTSSSSGAKQNAPAIKGGPIEVGVLWPEGSTYFNYVKQVGDSVVKDFPGTEMTYTFANTGARPQLDLRWKGGNPPDIDNLYTYGDTKSHHWVKEGTLAELTTAMTTAQWGDGLTWEKALRPVFRSICKYEGKDYGAPDQAAVFGLFYNKKMFDSFGLKPPTTWDELIQVGEALKAKGVDPVAVTGTFTPYMGQWWDDLLQREVGAKVVMDTVWGDKKLSDNPGFLRAAKKLQDVVDRGFFMKGFEGTDFTAAQIQFFQGKTGMILMGSWLVTEMKDSIPKDFQVAITPFPKVPGGQGDQNGLFGHVYCWNVAAASKNKDLAIEYLRRSQSKEEQTKRVADLGIISPYQNVPMPTAVPGLDKVVDQASNSEFIDWYYGIVYDKERWDAWYTPVSELFFKKISAENMVQKIDTNLARLRGK